MEDYEVNQEVRKAYHARCTSYRNALSVLEEFGNPDSIHTITTRAILRGEYRHRLIQRSIIIGLSVVWVVLLAAVLFVFRLW